MVQHRKLVGSFGQVAKAYDRSRPGYPDAAVDWLIPDGARRILDLGAGTGKLTASLVARGLDVVAVDPSDKMLEVLQDALPEVQAVVGSGEQVPFEDGSFDAVLVAQAWHWVDPERAVPEVARVLAPGGRLGLIYNHRDHREPWVADLWHVVHPGEQPNDRDDVELGPPFGPVQRFETPWAADLAIDDVVDLAASRSYVFGLGDQERAALLERVRGLCATHPSLAGRDRVLMPYVTQCQRADLPA